MIQADQDPQGASAGSNHPLAMRMAVIAFITNNITIGALWGSFSVLLLSVESRLGVGRELSTLGIPVVNLVMTICAPIVGVLATRYSIRNLMILGAALYAAGFALLAFTANYSLYLIAYGLFLGPGMALGVILPPTLVTRWFVVNRGKTLGIVSMPAVIACVPLVATYVLQSFGLSAAYELLAAMSVIALIANFFTIDYPPGAEVATPTAKVAAAPEAQGTMSVADILRSPRFWMLSVAAVSSPTASVLITAHMVPMASTWGFSATMAATLLTVQSLVGIAGTILFGAIGDRIGSVKALALLILDSAILWALLLLHPPFPATVVLVGLIGLHGAGVLPLLSMVLGEAFGRVNFSRVYGLANFLNLPMTVICVPAAAFIYKNTGSYNGAIIGQVVFFIFALLLALSAQRKKPAIAAS